MSVARVMSTRTQIAFDHGRCVFPVIGWLCSESATGQQDSGDQHGHKPANPKKIDGVFAEFHGLKVVAYELGFNVSELRRKASICIDGFKDGRFFDDSAVVGVAHQ